MIHLENILVPVDFSNTSEMALRFGVSLALQLHSRLTVAHVMPSLQEFGLADEESSGNLKNFAVHDTETRLRALIPAEQQALLDIRTVTKEGDVREQLLHVIEQEKIALVILGTHGLRGIAKFFLGSTTEHILRSVPVPILTVSPFIKVQAQQGSKIQIRRMVFASDLSAATKSGLQYAAALASVFGARLTLLHVIEPLESGQFGVDIPGYVPFDPNTIQVEAENFLKDAIAGADVKSIQVDTAVIEGVSHSSIVHFADECNADLLVLNLQSKRFLERMMLGATAERVIRSSHIPVLSIPIGIADRFLVD